MFTEFKESNVRAGLGTALCVMKPNETKYHILSAVESLPAVFGNPENIEYSSTTNYSVTNVKGKNSIENVSVVVPYNLDNIYLLEDIKDVKCKFAYIDLDDFTGQTFVATPTYYMSEVATGSIKTITVYLTIENAESSIKTDLYDLYMDTVAFESTIPSTVVLKGTASAEYQVVVSPTTASATATCKDTAVATATLVSGKLTITGKAAGSTIVTIDAEGSGLAGNKRYIKVIIQ